MQTIVSNINRKPQVQSRKVKQIRVFSAATLLINNFRIINFYVYKI